MNADPIQRLSALAGLAAILVSTPALAQAWSDYVFREAGVAVQFPAPPTASQTAIPAGDAMAPATVYALQQGPALYQLSVADFSAQGGALGKAARQALTDLRATGQVRLDVEECISGHPGRELSLAGADGGQTKASVFTVGRRLYVLQVRLANDPAADTGDAVRFQQSMSFSGRGLGPAELGGECRGRARDASEVGP